MEEDIIDPLTVKEFLRIHGAIKEVDVDDIDYMMGELQRVPCNDLQMELILTEENKFRFKFIDMTSKDVNGRNYRKIRL